MKIAIPVQGDHVATVFDGAEELLIVEERFDRASNTSRTPFAEETDIAKVAYLKEQHVQVLICGALPGFLQRMLEAAGVHVFSFIRGPVDEVVQAFYDGNLDEQRFFLPGCRPRRFPFPRRRCCGKRIKTGGVKKHEGNCYNSR